MLPKIRKILSFHWLSLYTKTTPMRALKKSSLPEKRNPLPQIAWNWQHRKIPMYIKKLRYFKHQNCRRANSSKQQTLYCIEQITRQLNAHLILLNTIRYGWLVFSDYLSASPNSKKEKEDIWSSNCRNYGAMCESIKQKCTSEIMELFLTDSRINFNWRKVTGQRSKPNETYHYCTKNLNRRNQLSIEWWVYQDINNCL